MSWDAVPFEPSHVDGVVNLSRALDRPSYADPGDALAALTAPGAVTWVAVREGLVIGLAHLLTDGRVQAHLSLVGVLPEQRRLGVARRLVTEAFRSAVYRSFLHQERVGFRIYPGQRS